MNKVRKATLNDVKQIHGLLNHFAKKGELLGRPLLALYEKIREFYVFEIDSQVVGCAALAIVWEDMAEIRSLAVKEECQGRKIGEQLVKAALQEAESLGIKKIFTLTYKPDFFKKYGFNLIDKKLLPHKIWTDCINCPHFPDCNEICLLKEMN